MYKIFKENNIQIFRFIVSGLIATIINFLVYKSVYLILKDIILASFTGYSSGLLFSFILSKIWVFRDKSKKRIVKSFIIFSLIYFLGGLEMSIITIFVNQLLNDYKIAWLFGALIASLNNYLGSKYILFKD